MIAMSEKSRIKPAVVRAAFCDRFGSFFTNTPFHDRWIGSLRCVGMTNNPARASLIIASNNGSIAGVADGSDCNGTWSIDWLKVDAAIPSLAAKGILGDS